MNFTSFPIVLDGKTYAEVFCFLGNPVKKGFITEITGNVPFLDDCGFAGYKSIEAFEKFLYWTVYGDSKAGNMLTWNAVTEDICKKAVESVIEKCLPVIEKNIKIFFFPTISKFVVEKMEGVSGFCAWKNTISLGVFHTGSLNEALKNTICHELAHALALNYLRRETLLDHLVFEGIAEHFRETFVGGLPSAWVNSIPLKEEISILRTLKGKLNCNDEQLYRELFFGTGKYPLWAGYAIGYRIVKKYLERQAVINWIKILKTNPLEIVSP